LAVCGASNVTGHVNDVHTLARTAHEYGCPILVDGAQLIPHRPFSMLSYHNPGHIDFLAFSGHKIFAPLGTGVLIAPKSLFKKGQPEYSGGGTVNMVFDHKIYWADPPDKEEAGSANVPGTFALARTLTCLKSLGTHKLALYEENLTTYTLEKLKAMNGFTIYGDKNRVGVISFNIEGMHHALVGAILCFEAGIGVRTGCFCAQKYVRNLLNLEENKIMIDSMAKHNYPGMVRISLAAYNTREEIDHLLHWLTVIRDNAEEYQKRYYYSSKYKCFYPANRDDSDIKLVLDKYLAI
jgi:selenocysteine lyase/cysteine desulfurase